jgi:Xaa-Pro dipeptidase
MPWLSERVHPSLGIPRVTAQDANDLMIGRIADAIAEMMAKYGVEREPLGIEGSTLSMLFAEAFKQRGIEVVHGKPVMDEARMIKTQDEIELMRITCANSERAFADIADAIRPGIRECDLVGIGIKALYQEGDDHTEDLVCCSGYNTNPYGWSFTDKPVRPGDLIYIDVDGASYQGYKSCVYRTFSCGKATQHQKDLYEECRAMLYAGMDAVKDGATDFDITDKWPQSPQYRPLITIVKKIAGYEPTKLRAGMVLALETYTGMKGGSDGVRLEENVLVTEDGYELLTRWPVDELMECWLPYR